MIPWLFYSCINIHFIPPIFPWKSLSLHHRFAQTWDKCNSFDPVIMLNPKSSRSSSALLHNWFWLQKPTSSLMGWNPLQTTYHKHQGRKAFLDQQDPSESWHNNLALTAGNRGGIKGWSLSAHIDTTGVVPHLRVINNFEGSCQCSCHSWLVSWLVTACSKVQTNYNYMWVMPFCNKDTMNVTGAQRSGIQLQPCLCINFITLTRWRRGLRPC